MVGTYMGLGLCSWQLYKGIEAGNRCRHPLLLEGPITHWVMFFYWAPSLLFLNLLLEFATHLQHGGRVLPTKCHKCMAC